MHNKYVHSTPGTKEYMLYTFFAAYINQDIESLDEAILDFKLTSSAESKILLVEAIDEFLETDCPEAEKFVFIEELSSGWIDFSTAKEQLIFIRDTFSGVS